MDNAFASDTTPVLITIPEAIARLNDTLDKGKRKGATLHIAETAPLMILRNFFILRLKGDAIMSASENVANMWRVGKGVALARRIRYLSRFYLEFKRLPAEARGGIRPGSSLLQVETVHNEVLAWLHRQSMGSITPEAFANAVTNDILPRRRYLETITIVDRTARRWLIKCGYTHKTTKKGVYEDGQEREDVVVYRNEVFLPRMADIERRAVAFESDGEGWKEIQPELLTGERRAVVYWHDESCYHQKDFKKHKYLRADQQFLPGKGMGRIVHVSDFITNVTSDGRLTYFDSATNTAHDARVIIKPGSKGDPWWDTKQLLSQVKRAVVIHDMKYGSDVEAVFVFDQSSAHASYGDGALSAFDMNKKDGAKRKEPVFYKDTIVPDDVPNVEMRGKVQAMMIGDQPKGTATVLAER